jgi:hypothetical protein
LETENRQLNGWEGSGSPASDPHARTDVEFRHRHNLIPPAGSPFRPFTVRVSTLLYIAIVAIPGSNSHRPHMGEKTYEIVARVLGRAPQWVRHDLAAKDAMYVTALKKRWPQ